MTNLISFFTQIFPIRKKPILYGLSNGAPLVAIYWYPFPCLIKGLALSSLMRNAIIVALVCLLAFLFLSGRAFIKDSTVIGWTTIGAFISGIVLVLLFQGEYIGSLISALCALVIYVVVSFFKKYRSES